MPAERVIWTVSREFTVITGPPGRGIGEECCADCLPLLIRRALRARSRAIQTGGDLRDTPVPMVMPSGSYGPCTIREPHPAPTTPAAGYGCPRPLAGACLDDTCDHD